MGYRRADGKVGIRNEIWIIPTVGCAAGVARLLAERAGEGVKAFSHPYGCSQLGGDLLRTQQVLRGLCHHPNAGGVLLLGLGCENNGIERMKEVLGAYDPQRIRFLNLQDCADEMEAGLAILSELKQVAAILKDVRDIQKETASKEVTEGGIRVVLEGEVAHFGG